MEGRREVAQEGGGRGEMEKSWREGEVVLRRRGCRRMESIDAQGEMKDRRDREEKKKNRNWRAREVMEGN